MRGALVEHEHKHRALVAGALRPALLFEIVLKCTVAVLPLRGVPVLQLAPHAELSRRAKSNVNDARHDLRMSHIRQ